MPAKKHYVLTNEYRVLPIEEAEKEDIGPGSVAFKLYDTFVPISDGKRLFIFDEDRLAPYGAIGLTGRSNDEIREKIYELESSLREAAYKLELQRVMKLLDKVFEMRDNGASVQECLNEFYNNARYNSLFNRTKAEITRVLLESLLDDEEELD